ncbi:MAG: protein deglycase HchA [Oceanospirillaceae bacterium]|nr:protein deglycase HchA [Oceanospirillaceae bacterium]HCI03136.1 protein deglycase HchA [Oceanospirillaceae bacterium]|tara:strand:+ start:782 stop:1639 length:858 start_codon:yes stop_codon:yes gene_type:complete
MLKSILGVAPKQESDGSYSPSKLALKLATVEKSDFAEIAYNKYQGKQSRIYVLFTEQKNMQMQNGKLFSTGNHPIEALLPMLHLKNAGFEFDILTPTGKPVVFEMWAFPKEDKAVQGIYDDYKSQFEQPKSLADLAPNLASDNDTHAAVFVPGGHGAMLGIPEDQNVGTLLRWAHNSDLVTFTLCHGPGSLLTTSLDDSDFLYAGYKMAVFPDSVDNMTPMIGYLPGKMPWGLSKKLEGLGVTLANSKPDDTVCIDRNLITGASPLASNNLGKQVANTLLAKLNS